ncbi:MAG TPA: Kdo hydroxylase family protein, partial [Casimicrobiaceae bacterium]|nr:Kdo hydroxylase family protein [Casimicrobiaceae bacterium]
GRPTIIFDPARGRIKRFHFALRDGRIVRARIRPSACTALEAMMARFGTWAEDLVASLLPTYRSVMSRDRVTYRPNERQIVQPLHIDSSYGHPTQGRGMLRVFCNVDPANRPRRWQVGEPFESFANRWIGSIPERSAGWSEALLARLGLVGPKESYDQLIADLRSAGKRDKEFQRTAPREIIEFPCGSTWIAITDLVVHGGLSGQHSLDQTFFLPAEGMRDPSRSSLRILERMTGRDLV